MASFCSTCGTRLEESAAFCEECGSPVTVAAPSVEAPPVAIDYQQAPPPVPARPLAAVRTQAQYTDAGRQMPPPAAPVNDQPAMPGGQRRGPAAPGGYTPPPVTPGNHSPQTATPGSYNPAPVAHTSGNAFTQFSGEMNREAPAKRTRGPGKRLSLMIIAAVVIAVGVGVFLLNNAMKPHLGGMNSTWATIIVNAAGEREVGTMSLSLNHRGEGTATFSGHPELAQPLTATAKPGKLTVTGPDISMTGKVEEISGEVDIQGSFKIAGRRGEWAALMQGTAAYSQNPASSGAAPNAAASPAAPGAPSVTAQQPENLRLGATLSDLVGEWEGTVRMHRLDGFDTVPESERPDNYQELLDELLASQHPCMFSIEDDGQWELRIDVMYGLYLESDIAKDYETGITPTSALIRPEKGLFNADFKMEDEQGTGIMQLNGAILDEEPLCIEGKFLLELNMGSSKVVMEGEYAVTKIKTEGE